MKEALAILFGGLGQGGFFALLAVGIVVAYRGSGVINFAQGAIAMFTAFEFHSLRTKGTLQLPWVDILPTKWLNIPVKIQLGGTAADNSPKPLAFLSALVVAVLVAMLLGAIAHFLVFRPLRSSAPLGKVIGSLGIMLYLQGVALKNFGTENPQPPIVLPKKNFENFLGLGKPIPRESFWMAVSAVIIGGGLWLLFRFTRFGLATRAAAGNEKGAVLLGYSPERLALANWVIASTTAGLAGILVGSITGALNPVKFTGLIVPALGAALIGALSSIPMALVGGIVIGLLQTFTSVWPFRADSKGETLIPLKFQSPMRDVLPLVVIIIVLFLRGRSLPIRGTVEEKRLPLCPYPKRVWQWCLIGGGIATAFAASTHGDGSKWGFALIISMTTAMIMLSYVVLTGYVGQISLAQMSIAGCAAFMASRMLANGKPNDFSMFPVTGPGLAWPIAMVIGVVFAVIVGVLLGLPALRIRGVQLAVVTIAAAVALQTLYFENESFTGLTAGSPAFMPDPTIFGVNVGSVGKGGLNTSFKFAVFVIITLMLLCVGVANIRRSGTGRRFLAVRANERASAAAGVNVMRTKLLAFAVASAIAGISGVMTAYQARSVSSAGWVFFASLAVLAFAFLGGITSINGALVGGLLFANGLITALGQHHYNGVLEYTSIIGGAAMIFTAIHNPGGIAPRLQPGFQYLGSWLRRARGKEWGSALKAVVPGTVLCSIPVALLLWNKATEWRNWFLLMVPGYGLFIRSIVKQIWTALAPKLGRKPSVPVATQAAAHAESLNVQEA
jgi:branched-chain amino acid transport system permease protein